MPTKGTCKAKDCEREVVGKGYCRKHYRMWKAGEMPDPRYKICTFEKCRKPRGAKGSLLVGPNEVSQHSGVRVSVADTVGSGDAFTAALLYHYLRHGTLATMNEAANRMGAWVASQTGATPPRDDYYLQQIRSAISSEE